MQPKYYTYDAPVALECGETLPSVTIAYHTYGTLSPASDNVIWVCHALTANSEVADWWPHTVETGRFLDPDKYFVVCANILGSCYGTTGPTSINPATGQPYYGRFPHVTVRDMVRCHQLLAKHLGIKQVELLAGPSIGGFQAIEWILMEPGWAKRCALLCTSPQVTPWIAGFNESQRMAIECDPTYGQDDPMAGRDGMAVARSMALLSYRGGVGYNLAQRDVNPDESLFEHRVQTYQRHQGEKLRRRYDCYAYLRMLLAVDSHNVARGRGSLEDVLRSIQAKVLLVACPTDILFPPEEQQPMRDYIPHNTFRLIHSPFGHDGFLVEYEQLDQIIREFMAEPIDK